MTEYGASGYLPLEMAGNTFLSTRTRKWNYVIRMGYLLKEDIDPERLRRAVEDIHTRFPSFFVGARRGFFRYYLECMNGADVVHMETEYPCLPFDLFSRTVPIIRVLYDRRRLSVEIPHLVADGKALTVFTRALLAHYLELGGLEIPPGSGLPDLREPPSAGELSDDYRRCYTKMPGKIPKDGAARQYRRPYIKNYLKVIHGTVPLADILTAAKARDVTVTEYLMCVYLYAFYRADPDAPHSCKPIKARIPVDMRQFYPSGTLRNFTLYRNLGFEPRMKENWGFDDIVEAMRGKLKPSVTPEAMRELLGQTVTMAGNPFLRVIPIGLKRWFFKLGYILTGEKPMTGVLSNLGRVALPPCVAERVESVEFIMGGSIFKSLSTFVLSDSRFLHIYFSGACSATDVQREFLRLLAEEGLRVRAECNIPGENEREGGL
ncbi:MAG: hypothetical protein FWF08_06555 [Oscillospiraceae bacterium]|nr:hypothetical protein [Oscillospiraceae bacterium]